MSIAFIQGLHLLLSIRLYSLADNNADAIVFESLGWDIAKAWTYGTVPPDTPGAYLYSKFIGAVYFVTGRSPFIIQYFNVFFGFITVYFMYKLVIELGGSKRSANIGALIAALFPTLNLYSAVTLRENIITMMSIISVFFFINGLGTAFNRMVQRFVFGRSASYMVSNNSRSIYLFLLLLQAKGKK